MWSQIQIYSVCILVKYEKKKVRKPYNIGKLNLLLVLFMSLGGSGLRMLAL